MKAVRSIKNQYIGINAHLHSFWQAEGGWDEFHAAHIIYLANALKIPLLPMGYTAGVQQSLQIRRANTPDGRPEADVLIYDTDPQRSYEPLPPSRSGYGLLVMPIAELLEAKEQGSKDYHAIGLYQFAPGKRDRGEPIVWIELLLPSNKPGGQNAAYYREKVLKLLRSGIVLIEIDYLHESAPTFPGIPNYRPVENGDALPQDAHPYRIVIDPRPTLMKGIARLYQFDVDEALPVVDIGLQGSAVLAFDFGEPYTRTLEESMFGLDVDYSRLPLNFQRYRKDDQSRIATRMVALLNAVRADVDLETGPFPVKAMPLEAALAEIEAWRAASA
ncbi:MAG: DUF4058 family protein [Caldilineaceae bacterium]